MYTGLYHTHKLTITIFILIYLVKTILLVSGKKEALANFSRRFLIFEISVSTLLLISGVWLLFETSEIRPLFLVKLGVVIIAIPMAFIGFKRQKTAIGVLSFLMLLSAYGIAEINKRTMVKRLELPKEIVTDVTDPDYSEIDLGQALYQSQCIVCHGEAGDLQMSGAKDLTASQMTREQVMQRIKEGKLTMLAYEDYFSQPEIEAVADYVMTLR